MGVRKRRTRILRRRRRLGRELVGSESRAAAIKGAFPPLLSAAAAMAEFLLSLGKKASSVRIS